MLWPKRKVHHSSFFPLPRYFLHPATALTQFRRLNGHVVGLICHKFHQNHGFVTHCILFLSDVEATG
jgi:hypothetical protein